MSRVRIGFTCDEGHCSTGRNVQLRSPSASRKEKPGCCACPRGDVRCTKERGGQEAAAVCRRGPDRRGRDAEIPSGSRRTRHPRRRARRIERRAWGRDGRTGRTPRRKPIGTQAGVRRSGCKRHDHWRDIRRLLHERATGGILNGHARLADSSVPTRRSVPPRHANASVNAWSVVSYRSAGRRGLAARRSCVASRKLRRRQADAVPPPPAAADGVVVCGPAALGSDPNRA